MTKVPNSKIISDLTALGLTEDDSRIYTYLIEVGTEKTKNSAYQISRNLKIPRSTVYLGLDRLMGRKLVDSYKINNILHFIAEHPNRIQHDLTEKQNIFQDLLPLLEGLRKGGNTYYGVRTYTGKDGVKLVFDEMFDRNELKTLKQIYSISSTSLSEVLPNGYPERLDRIKKKFDIHTKVIAVATDGSRLDYVYKSDSNRESRLLPSKFNFDGSLYVFNNKIALFSLSDDEVYSVIIESKTLSLMIRNFFMCTWELLKDSQV